MEKRPGRHCLVFWRRVSRCGQVVPWQRGRAAATRSLDQPGLTLQDFKALLSLVQTLTPRLSRLPSLYGLAPEKAATLKDPEPYYQQPELLYLSTDQTAGPRSPY
jgi:hypothetical protein